MSLAPCTRLGAYEVLALIGAGSMRDVYRARDSKLNRDVAIKGLAGRLRQRSRAAVALHARSTGVIVFAPSTDSVLMRVMATGGTPGLVTRFTTGQGSHRWPQFLPDGQAPAPSVVIP